jgi:asparagine synthase (glutamine-hydrolysing)
MCGIAGLVYKNYKTAEVGPIKKMTDAIMHRGPDGEGQYTNGNVALGHRRLSIIDLSDNGSQPMHSHDGRYVIVFNGEIFNYIELKEELKVAGASFCNNTDTEVIIEAYRLWGDDCVKRFNGMWAFCIYDTAESTLFISRDRFGVKPLYILNRDDLFAFSSEAKGILAAFPEENIPDANMIYRFLNVANEDRDTTSYYKNIKIFMRSRCMKYDLKTNTITEWQFWDVNEKEFYDKWIAGNDPVETFRSLFEDAVKVRLRADVEVGACLSGGLDSSAIVGICTQKYGIKMHTFSSIYSDKNCNEKKYIDLVNKYNNTKPHLIYPEPEKSSLIEAFKKIIYHHDGPNMGASLYSQYSVMQGIQGHVKVVLDGQGADELFAGYIPYYANRLSDIMGNNSLFSRLKGIRLVAILIEEWPSMFNSLKSNDLLNLFGINYYKKIKESDKFKNRDIICNEGTKPMFTKELLDNVDKTIEYSEMNISGELNTRLCKDIYRDSIPSLLHNEDSNSMAFSIESRTPFLDYRIVEFGIALDGKYKIRNEWTKWIIRKSCRDYIPKEVALRKNKMGFPAPFSRWLRECNEKDEMKDIIYSFGERGIVPKDTIDYYYKQHINNNADRNVILYKFLVLELWLRTCNKFDLGS